MLEINRCRRFSVKCRVLVFRVISIEPFLEIRVEFLQRQVRVGLDIIYRVGNKARHDHAKPSFQLSLALWMPGVMTEGIHAKHDEQAMVSRVWLAFRVLKLRHVIAHDLVR